MKYCECGRSVKSKGEMHRTVEFSFTAGYSQHRGRGDAIQFRIYGGPRVNYRPAVYTLISKCTLDASSQLLKFILLQVQNTEMNFLSDLSNWVGVLSRLL